jgi:hypothetical protein
MSPSLFQREEEEMPGSEFELQLELPAVDCLR